jgi:hypothetical protein
MHRGGKVRTPGYGDSSRSLIHYQREAKVGRRATTAARYRLYAKPTFLRSEMSVGSPRKESGHGSTPIIVRNQFRSSYALGNAKFAALGE